jgi:hypothetical protein
LNRIAIIYIQITNRIPSDLLALQKEHKQMNGILLDVINKTKMPNYKVACNFLEQLSNEMCRSSIHYFDSFSDRSEGSSWHPLTLNERAMYALLASSAAKISPIVLSEIPIARHKKAKNGFQKKGEAGRVDLWICLDDNTQIILELKRVDIGLGKDPIPVPKKLTSKWDEVVKQAEASVKHTDAWAKKTIHIGILVVYGYVSSSKKYKEFLEISDYKKRLISAVDTLKQKASWAAIWTPPKEMRLHQEQVAGKIINELNPAVGFMAYIHRKN